MGFLVLNANMGARSVTGGVGTLYVHADAVVAVYESASLNETSGKKKAHVSLISGTSYIVEESVEKVFDLIEQARKTALTLRIQEELQIRLDWRKRSAERKDEYLEMLRGQAKKMQVTANIFNPLKMKPETSTPGPDPYPKLKVERDTFKAPYRFPKIGDKVVVRSSYCRVKKLHDYHPTWQDQQGEIVRVDANPATEHPIEIRVRDEHGALRFWRYAPEELLVVVER